MHLFPARRAGMTHICTAVAGALICSPRIGRDARASDHSDCVGKSAPRAQAETHGGRHLSARRQSAPTRRPGRTRRSSLTKCAMNLPHAQGGMVFAGLAHGRRYIRSLRTSGMPPEAMLSMRSPICPARRVGTASRFASRARAFRGGVKSSVRAQRLQAVHTRATYPRYDTFAGTCGEEGQR